MEIQADNIGRGETTSSRVTPIGADAEVAGWGATMTRIVSRGSQDASRESTTRTCFRMSGLLICWLSLTGLYLGKIKEDIVLPTGERAETSACHSEIPLLTIQPQNSMIEGKLPTLESTGKSLYATEQLPTIVSVACIPERAEPLLRVRKPNRATASPRLRPVYPGAQTASKRR